MNPKNRLCSAWHTHIVPCLVKKKKLYGRFLYFRLRLHVSNLWNIFLINTGIFWWANFWKLDRNIQVGQNICVFHTMGSEDSDPSTKSWGAWDAQSKYSLLFRGDLWRRASIQSGEKGWRKHFRKRLCKRSHWESLGMGEGHEIGPGQGVCRAVKGKNSDPDRWYRCKLTVVTECLGLWGIMGETQEHFSP